MRIIISAFLLFISITTYSQTLNVIPDPSATNLANIITGYQTTISNAILNCPGIASGTLCTTNDGLGLRNGIVLSSGSVTNLVGPNIQSGISANNFALGDTGHLLMELIILLQIP